VDHDYEVKADFSGFRGSVFVSYADTAETIRLLRLSSPVKGIMRSDYPELTEADHFDEAKQRLIGSEYRGLPVFSDGEARSFRGVVTRRYFIDKPRRKVILVDHNESEQSVKGIEEAEVVEILDHHRLAPDKTRLPIYVAARPVGSTCTIVYQHYLQFAVELDRHTAQVLLAGLLSDTVILKSPTTTEEDRRAARHLAEIAGLDYLEFGERIFRHSAVLKEQSPADIVAGDFKSYEEQGYSFGIGQVEVVTFQNLEEVREGLLEALEQLRRERGMDWTMLLVTNVLKEHSKLLLTPFPQAEQRLLYNRESEQLYDLPEILSRKKQLLPEVIRVLEELGGGS
jgi:manganese-dependent inorganic pyrophosphatase